MIEISKIRDYYEKDTVIISEHAAMRCRQRGIRMNDIRCTVNNGKIIEQYPEDSPYQSCLILGLTEDGKCLHVVISDEGSMSRIITAYYPDPDKWDETCSIRKE